MNWQWAFDQGLLPGTDPNWYASGQATADEYAHAVETAYKNSTDENRKELVDMLWTTGAFEGTKEHWYTFRESEIGDLSNAARGLKDSISVGTGPEGTKPRFGLAGGAQLWKNTTTGESYIVYTVPGTEDDPIYMRWTVPSPEDVQSFFGPGQPVVYQQEISGGDPLWGDAIDFGGSTDIKNTAINPFESWASTLETEALSQPWLLDEDYQKLLAMSVIEERVLTTAEIKSTQWWRGNTDAARKWMELYHGDPSEADRYLTDNRTKMTDLLRDSGMNDPDSRLVDFMADKVTKGDWSQTEAVDQIRILTDQYFSDQPLNTELDDFMTDNGISSSNTEDMETEVRNLVTRWLGTNFGDWSDEEIGHWAGRMRNEGDAQEALLNTLKDQKQALFPEYDREADYNAIASPWRTMMNNMWGEVPNDSDITLQNIIKMNDATEASRFLTDTGMKQGNQLVTNSVQTAMNNSFGGTAVG